jgi:5-hydroxyisourate hydrolase
MAVTPAPLDGAAGATLKQLAAQRRRPRRQPAAGRRRHALAAGRYRLLFEVAPYFRARGVALPEPPSSTRCRWTSASPMRAATTTCRCWCQPWSYSTYRGS